MAVTEEQVKKLIASLQDFKDSALTHWEDAKTDDERDYYQGRAAAYRHCISLVIAELLGKE